ncbi:MAG: S46 family peptidase, partial [Bacteroides sp.]|nr:S46 family peptidase [Bacteroides sp.]
MRADEGMWLLPDLKEQNEVLMKEMGLEIPIEKIY